MSFSPASNSVVTYSVTFSRASALAAAERFNKRSYVIMIRSMAASMESSRCGGMGRREYGRDRSDALERLVPGDRLVGEPDLVELAALEQLHDNRQQLFVGGKAVG